jgi:hypothetical protein
MGKRVVIAGGTGLIGGHLTEHLASRGDEVIILTRSKKSSAKPGGSYVHWNPELQLLDMDFDDIDYVVNLAGAGIADKRWTKKYKKEIIGSRVDSTKLLADTINKVGENGPSLIQIAGANYYGADSEEIHDEADPPGNDFIAEVCRLWEAEARKLSDRSKLSILRMSPVLAEDGGALPQMAFPVKLGFGTALGSGKQYMPWVHIEDICGIITWLIDNPDKSGLYNVAAPDNVTNKQFMRTLAKVLRRPFFLPNVPLFVLKILFGEVAYTLTGNNEVSIMRLIEAGYKFKHPDLKGALEDLLKRKN